MNNLLHKYISLAVFCIFGMSNVLTAQSLKWAKGIGGSGNDQGRSIGLDDSGNVYTTGFFSGTCDFDPGTGVVNLTSAGATDIFVSKVDSVGNFVWAKQIGGTGDDVGLSISIHPSGNIYITGYFSSTADFDPGASVVNLTSAGGEDIFILKLNASGDYVWAKKVGGINSDRCLAITTDATGNIYATGGFSSTVDFDPGAGVFNLTSAGQSDIFVLKLSASGDLIWAKNMGGSGTESGGSIAIDASGNVYTSGQFVGPTMCDFDPGASVFNLSSTAGSDSFLSKLDANGDFVWAKKNGGNGGSRITIDPSGNLCTTGYFTDTDDFDPGVGVFELTSTGFYDIFVSKLDAVGNFLWAKNMGGFGADFGFAICTDALGNIYTTGEFQGGANADFDPGTGVFNFTSAGGGEIFISKLDPQGDFVWAQCISGNNYEDGRSIKVDASGNIYLTGNFAETADFDPSSGIFNLTSSGGDDIFVYKMSQTSCATPNQPSNISGNINVNPSTSETYSVTNDPTATSYIWTLPSGWLGTSTTNSINVTTGSTGGVISVAAQNSCGNSSPSILTISTTIPSGSENHEWTWAKSSGNTFAAQYAMNTVTDTEDNAYVTGHFNSSTLIFGGITLNKVGSGTSIYIAKYNSDGSVAWAKTAGGSNQNSESWDIDIDASNNVYIMGTFSSPTITFESTTLTHTGNGSDIFIAKYDSNGNLIWAKEIDYTSTLFLYDIDVDLNGNIFIGGSFSIDPITIGSTTLLSNANTHPFIAKFDTNGNALWAKAPQNSTSYANWGTAITSDIYGNVYFTGQYNASSSDPFIIDGISLPYTNFKKHIFLVKYDPSGNFSWVKTFGGTTNISSSDYPHGLTCDSQGNLIMIGAMRSESLSFDAITITNSNNNNINPEIFLVKFDESGNSLWAKTAGGLASDAGHRIATDEFDNLYISGYFESKPASFGSITITKEDNGSPIIYVAKYDENGVEKWVKHVENTTGKYGDLPANGIAVSNIGSIYVVGTAYYNAVFGSTTLSQGGIFIAKMGPSIVAVKELNDGGNKLQIYPNPSNGIIYLRALNAQWDSEIEIYNLQGQLIFESNHFESEIDLSNQPKGMYTVKLKSDNDVFVEKIILK
jgi:hypothetical protein